MFTTMCPKEQQTSDNLIVKTTVLSLKYLINVALVVPHTWGKIFLCSHLSFTAAYSLKSKKDWHVDFAKL